MIAVILIGSFFFVYPFSANASLFSFFAGLANKSAQASSVVNEKPNSQTIALLSPQMALATSSTPDFSAEIVDGTALAPTANVADSNLTFTEGVDNNGSISLYVVKEGDTLSGIAKMFGVSTNTIVWANDFLAKGQKVKVGDKLVILPVSGIRHIIQKGETVQSIAKKYKANVNDIISYNDLGYSASQLTAGDSIIIPNGQEIAATAAHVAQTTKTSTAHLVTSISLGGASDGYFIIPVVGAIKTQGLHGRIHNAVDLAAPTGTDVRAAAAGTVTVAITGGYNGGFGSYIVINHSNGTQTLYAHLSKLLVSEGDTVSQGEVIGKVGSTGESTGPHLHFEISPASYVNPF